MNLYAGIGSRQTPRVWCDIMFEAGRLLAMDGWMLRSGGAMGADAAFELGCDAANGRKEIFLPWKKFNKNQSPFYEPTDEAMQLTSGFHPKWHICDPSARLLHARNAHQVLGKDLKTPVDCVVCYTPNHGGTLQALRIAASLRIPVMNLHDFGQPDDTSVSDILLFCANSVK